MEIPKLVDLCARYVATNLPFERVETYGLSVDDDDMRLDFDREASSMLLPRHPVPEDLQLKIAAESFPSTIDNIRLYSCLVNGNVDEYLRGEQLYQSGCVRRIIQIGFHLSAEVTTLNPNLNSSSQPNAASAMNNNPAANTATSSRLVLGASANTNYQVNF